MRPADRRGGESVHHADDPPNGRRLGRRARMICPECGTPWPCGPFLMERQRVDDQLRLARGRGPVVVYPERRP